jgi:hypothetical protein
MRIIHCFPSEAAKSKVLAAAKAVGIDTQEEGLCIHFGPPKDMDELNTIRNVLRIKDALSTARK